MSYMPEPPGRAFESYDALYTNGCMLMQVAPQILYAWFTSGLLMQVAGMRSNLWPGAAAVASGAAFTNVYVGWGVKTGPFLPLPPPPVAQEYDQVHVLSLLALCLVVLRLGASFASNPLHQK